MVLVSLASLAVIAGLSYWMLGTPAPAPLVQTSAPDGCVACHGEPKDDPGGVHAAATIGCASCHLGDREATTAEAAHAGMEPEPGALSTVKQTCGSCHAREAEEGWQLFPKAGGAPRIVRATPRDPSHEMKGHERLSCAACHSAWIPTCTSCHTTFDPTGKQWDFGHGAETAGAWQEENEGMGYGPPGLAVAPGGKIEPAAPGMIAKLDAGAAGGKLRDVRLVSTFDPHTTVKAARDCASCHRSANALGLGSGELELARAGPRFTPDRPVQGFAHDGWTRLFPEQPAQGTSAGARGLDAAEQRRVLQVGVCVECHTHAGDPIWSDFAASVKRLRSGAPKCVGRSDWLGRPPLQARWRARRPAAPAIDFLTAIKFSHQIWRKYCAARLQMGVGRATGLTSRPVNGKRRWTD